jgi:hypothetical protein
MAPLAGLEQHPLAPVWHRVGNFVFRYGEHFYNFEGLRRYKAKFRPEWEPKYLVAPGGIALPRIMFDVSALIAGGVKELFSPSSRRRDRALPRYGALGGRRAATPAPRAPQAASNIDSSCPRLANVRCSPRSGMSTVPATSVGGSLR